MDTKRTFINMAVIAMLCVLWLQVGYPWLAHRLGWNIAPPPSVTSQPVGGNEIPSTSVATATQPTTVPLTTPHVVAATRPNATPVILGSAQFDPKGILNVYPVGLSLTPRGAGVASVTLNRFRNQLDQPEPYVYQKPYEIDSPLAVSLATRSATIDGGAPISLDQVDWQSAGSDSSHASASFQADLAISGAAPQIRITKTYHLDPASTANGGYEIAIDYTITNLTPQPHRVQLAFNGPNSPKPENNRDLAQIVAGFDRGNETVNLKNSLATSLKAGQPLDIPNLGDGEPMLWAGLSSVYFNALVRPTDAAGAPQPLNSVTASWLNPEEHDAEKRAVAIACESKPFDIAPSSSVQEVLHVYLGPKSRAVISNDYYSDYPRSYNATLVLSSGWACYSWCTWPLLINALVKLLQGFHFILRDWGLSIIALVLVVRLILHPITKSSQMSMSKMTKLGPEMERLKKKYGEDTEGLKQAQIEFYREQGVAPFLGCLPMFLQTPIWIALWSALQSTFEIRQAPFLRFGPVHLTWIKDLSQPDHLLAFGHTIGLGFIHFDALNLLPIMMGVVMYINQKLMPQPVALKPEQAQQQKMMQLMTPFLFPLFLYSSPSGLNLYIFTSTLIGIFESRRIRTHIKEREEREKQGLIIVDEPVDARRGNGVKGKGKGKPQKRTGAIVGLFMKLQQLAEEAKTQQEKQQKKNR